jgi:hypothetical protein
LKTIKKGGLGARFCEARLALDLIQTGETFGVGRGRFLRKSCVSLAGRGTIGASINVEEHTTGGFEMLRGFIVYVVFCLLAIDCAIQAQDHNRAILQRKLTAEIEKIANAHDGVMGVAIKDLTTGEEILINDQLVFPTGSSIKIPVLIELHKQASAGKYKLTDQRWVERADKVGGSGVIINFGDSAITPRS